MSDSKMLGKRKRDHATVPRQSLHESEGEKATNITNKADLFRQYFEAQFEPLPQESSLSRTTHGDEDKVGDESRSETSDWSGFTENDTSVEEVRVIEHTAVSEVTAESGASEGKYFMVRSSYIH
jgi:hypothetical protein